MYVRVKPLSTEEVAAGQTCVLKCHDGHRVQCTALGSTKVPCGFDLPFDTICTVAWVQMLRHGLTLLLSINIMLQSSLCKLVVFGTMLASGSAGVLTFHAGTLDSIGLWTQHSWNTAVGSPRVLPICRLLTLIECLGQRYSKQASSRMYPS